MTQGQMRKLCEVVETNGRDRQIDKFIEKSAELTVAILRYKDARDNKQQGSGADFLKLREAIIDELAEVKILEQQLEIIFGCCGEVEERIDSKIEHQIKRTIVGGREIAD